MRQKIISTILLLCLFLSCISVSGYAATYEEINNSANNIETSLKNASFSFGDEWLMIDLARLNALTQTQAQDYVNDVTAHLKSTQGVLSTRKYTEYSRTILALSALGLDASNIAGYDLTAPLADFEQVCFQGINGPIFALLALDSRNYRIPQNNSAKVQATRKLYLDYILKAQTTSGGWNLAADPAKSADVDLTAMALQALSKYRERANVSAAIDKAMAYLLSVQNSDGSYSSDNIPNAESTSQVIIALGELGIDAQSTAVNKAGVNMVDALLKYSTSNGFKHKLSTSSADYLATEQALLALCSLKRQNNHLPSLYRMSDAKNILSSSAPTNSVINIPPVSRESNFTDIASSPYREAVLALAARGMVSGRGYNKFYPASTITRAEFAAILVKTLGLSQECAIPFTDVSAKSWYNSAVKTVYNYKLIAGISADKFNPNGTLTRQEAAVMISRAAGLCGLKTAYSERERQNILCVYNDYRTCAAWSTEALAWAYDKHILDDTVWEINPNENISRGEIAQMLYNMLILAELI